MSTFISYLILMSGIVFFTFLALAVYGWWLESHPERLESTRRMVVATRDAVAAAYAEGVADGRLRAVVDVAAEVPTAPVAAPIDVAPVAAPIDDEYADDCYADDPVALIDALMPHLERVFAEGFKQGQAAMAADLA